MTWKQWVVVGITSAIVGSATGARAGDLRIKLPKRSQTTPVQRLNQEGVEDIRKHNYDKAETSFE